MFRHEPAPNSADQPKRYQQQAKGPQQSAHPVGLEGIHHIASDEQREAGGHSARRAGPAGPELEVALGQTELHVGFHAQGLAAFAIRIQPDGDGEDGTEAHRHEHQQRSHPPLHCGHRVMHFFPIHIFFEQWRRHDSEAL